jgi:hypothetical protein
MCGQALVKTRTSLSGSKENTNQFIKGGFPMFQNNTNAQHRIWHDNEYASLCVLGVYLRRMGFFRPVEQGMHIRQKVLK